MKPAQFFKKFMRNTMFYPRTNFRQISLQKNEKNFNFGEKRNHSTTNSLNFSKNSFSDFSNYSTFRNQLNSMSYEKTPTSSIQLLYRSTNFRQEFQEKVKTDFAKKYNFDFLNQPKKTGYQSFNNNNNSFVSGNESFNEKIIALSPKHDQYHKIYPKAAKQIEDENDDNGDESKNETKNYERTSFYKSIITNNGLGIDDNSSFADFYSSNRIGQPLFETNSKKIFDEKNDLNQYTGLNNLTENSNFNEPDNSSDEDFFQKKDKSRPPLKPPEPHQILDSNNNEVNISELLKKFNNTLLFSNNNARKRNQMQQIEEQQQKESNDKNFQNEESKENNNDDVGNKLPILELDEVSQASFEFCDKPYLSNGSPRSNEEEKLSDSEVEISPFATPIGSPVIKYNPKTTFNVVNNSNPNINSKNINPLVIENSMTPPQRDRVIPRQTFSEIATEVDLPAPVEIFQTSNPDLSLKTHDNKTITTEAEITIVVDPPSLETTATQINEKIELDISDVKSIESSPNKLDSDISASDEGSEVQLTLLDDDDSDEQLNKSANNEHDSNANEDDSNEIYMKRLKQLLNIDANNEYIGELKFLSDSDIEEHLNSVIGVTMAMTDSNSALGEKDNSNSSQTNYSDKEALKKNDFLSNTNELNIDQSNLKEKINDSNLKAKKEVNQQNKDFSLADDKTKNDINEISNEEFINSIIEENSKLNNENDEQNLSCNIIELLDEYTDISASNSQSVGILPASDEDENDDELYDIINQSHIHYDHNNKKNESDAKKENNLEINDPEEKEISELDRQTEINNTNDLKFEENNTNLNNKKMTYINELTMDAKKVDENACNDSIDNTENISYKHTTNKKDKIQNETQLNTENTNCPEQNILSDNLYNDSLSNENNSSKENLEIKYDDMNNVDNINDEENYDSSNEEIIENENDTASEVFDNISESTLDFPRSNKQNQLETSKIDEWIKSEISPKLRFCPESIEMKPLDTCTRYVYSAIPCNLPPPIPIIAVEASFAYADKILSQTMRSILFE